MKFSPSKTAFYLFLLLAFTFLIRFAHVLLLRTQTYSVAETEIIYIQSSIKIIFNNLNPGLFFHASLYFYLISFLYCCLFAVGHVLGWFFSSVDFMMLFLEKPAIFYFISRMVSVLASVGTVYLIYRLGSFLWNKKTGLLAAFLFSLMPMAIRQGTEASVYSLTSFLIVLSAFWWFKFIEKPDLRGILKASVAFGFALAADYYALFLIPFFVLTIMRKEEGNKDVAQYLHLPFGTVPLIFFIANPYFLINPSLVWQSIATQAHTAIYSEYNQYYSTLRYLLLLLRPPYFLVSIFFLIGAHFAIQKQRFWAIALLSFPAANIVFFSFSKIQLEHYIFHSLPFITLLSASAMTTLIRLRSFKYAAAVLITVCIISLGIKGYEPGLYNRDAWAAKKWIEENIPKRSAILIQPDTIPFAQPILFHLLYNPQNNSNERFYFAVLDQYLRRHPDEDYQFWTCNFVKGTIPLISDRNIQYIVLSERDYDQYGAPWLVRNAALIKTFSQFGDTWRIRIYKVLNPSVDKNGRANTWW